MLPRLLEICRRRLLRVAIVNEHYLDRLFLRAGNAAVLMCFELWMRVFRQFGVHLAAQLWCNALHATAEAGLADTLADAGASARRACRTVLCMFALW